MLTGTIEAGFKPPFRVDDEEHEGRINTAEYRGKIDDRILAEIRGARFVVVDVTGGRQSVYFEAGFADGLGHPIIWCCRDDRAADMAFDTRQNGHILWATPADLKTKLLAKIRSRGWTVPG